MRPWEAAQNFKMKQIQVFNHAKFGEIRTMTNEKGETFFVGKDVAAALGYERPQNAIAAHVDKEDKTTALIQGTGSNYKTRVVVINESGLYSLILSSKLSQARAFKRWVTSEVLPQIRNTGGYIPVRDSCGRALTNEEILQVAQEIVGRTLRMLNKPNECCLTMTAVAESWGMDLKSFRQLLLRMGVLCRRGRRWYIARELEGKGLTQTRHFLYYSLRGEQKTRTYMVWTPEGVSYLNSRFLSEPTPAAKVIQLNLFV